MCTDLLGTAEASFELNRTYKVDIGQRRLWQLIADGHLPATRLRGRWYLLRADLPRVAEILGLAPPPTTPERPRRKTPTRSRAAATA